LEDDVQLTSRQRAFLEKLLDVYHSHRQQPIHYTALARALGVANSTSYEMLRLLEQKGYVCSEYRLSDHHTGPGRSMVVFRPTIKALRVFRHLLGEDARHKEWDFVKEKVLGRLVAEGLPEDDQFLGNLIAAIPESEDSLSYCVRVMAASLLSIKSQLLSRVQELSMFRHIVAGDAASLDALNLLPGFALGFSCALQRNWSWLSRLAECVERYQTYLRQMDEEARVRLLRFSREMIDALHMSAGSG
jgi:DNA-binding MarR family transcriptional regulator